MHFSLPESYAAYAAQKEIRTVVDHILNSKKLEVPSDLDWSQLPDFHAAVLASYQVRSDYASALHRLWNEVWKSTLDSSNLDVETLSIGESYELEEAKFDTKSIWESQQYWQYIRTTDSLIVVPGVSLNINKAQLWLWIGNENLENNMTEELLDSISDWYMEEEDETLYGYTRKELAPIIEASIEVECLCVAAIHALDKLDKFIESRQT